ncbi:MAG: BACON domain-containing protein, partial [Limisphaerales bacterium]
GIPIPSWQTNVSMANNGGSATFRNVPDVALTADNIYVVYGQGQNGGFGGTSCAAPLWAGFAAMINQQAVARREPTVGFINPAVYAIGLSGDYTNCFHDIIAGNNTNSTVGNKYFATNGYDLCTGWGTPTGSNLINALTAPPNTLTITPAAGFTAVGPVGGPFVPGSQIYALTNIGGSPLEWSLANTSSWLVVSMTNGALAAGTGTNVIISISINADGLGLGAYAASITFTNISSNTVQSLQFALQTVDPLVVTPGSGFTASGAEGGPFAPASQAFALTNIGAVPIIWRASGPAWLDLAPSNGMLDAGATTTVTASLNAAANNYTAGVYTGPVAFTDDNSGFVQDRPFSLSIGQNIVLNGGFEMGDFTDWDLVTNGFGTIVDNGDVSGLSPESGIYFAALGQNG